MAPATSHPIPPDSELSVKEIPDSPYLHLAQQRLRVGYYSRQDGLDCIWIVYPDGKYGETIDHAHLDEFFVVKRLSNVTDFFGDGSRPLKALT